MGSFLCDYAFAGQFFFNSFQVGFIWIAEICSTSAHTRFVVNSVPYCLVIHACSNASTHSKRQPTIKSLLKQQQYFFSFWSVRQICQSGCALKWYSFSLARLQIICDDYRASTFRITLASQIFINMMFHLSIRLIALHLPEYSRTNWTFRPFLLSDHMDQAGPVVLVGAAEHENVIIIIMLILLDEIFLDLVLIQTNHALLILDVCLSQQKLQS